MCILEEVWKYQSVKKEFNRSLLLGQSVTIGTETRGISSVDTILDPLTLTDWYRWSQSDLSVRSVPRDPETRLGREGRSGTIDTGPYRCITVTPGISTEPTLNFRGGDPRRSVPWSQHVFCVGSVLRDPEESLDEILKTCARCYYLLFETSSIFFEK
jgi:hypothetical protein